MKYWFNALIGIVLTAAAVTVVAWCTYAWTRTSLCSPADDALLACKLGGGQFAVVIGVTLFVVIPFASMIFMHRTRPRGTSLGLLGIGLAMTAAGGSALAAALGSTSTSVEVAGYIAAGMLLSFGPLALFGGIATSGRRGTALLAQRAAVIAAHGGDVAQAVNAMRAASNVSAGASFGSSAAAATAASGSSPAVASRPLPANAPQFGALAAQLSQIAAARERTSGEAIATSLRQLDDLRASGLLSPEEHARKRREILDKL